MKEQNVTVGSIELLFDILAVVHTSLGHTSKFRAARVDEIMMRAQVLHDNQAIWKKLPEELTLPSGRTYSKTPLRELLANLLN